MPDQKAVAMLTIRKAGKMTPGGRKALSAWLVKMSKAIIKDGERYSDRFTAGYFSR
jgi:hypothetical protein